MPPPRSQNKRVFGQATRRSGSTNYQRQQGKSGGNGKSHSARELTEEQEKAQRRLAMKLKRRSEGESFDEQNGFRRFHHGNSLDSNTKNVPNEKGDKKGEVKVNEKRGWVFNMLPTVSNDFVNWQYEHSSATCN
jgi:hypothetical protein